MQNKTGQRILPEIFFKNSDTAEYFDRKLGYHKSVRGFFE